MQAHLCVSRLANIRELLFAGVRGTVSITVAAAGCAVWWIWLGWRTLLAHLLCQGWATHHKAVFTGRPVQCTASKLNLKHQNPTTLGLRVQHGSGRAAGVLAQDSEHSASSVHELKAFMTRSYIQSCRMYSRRPKQVTAIQMFCVGEAVLPARGALLVTVCLRVLTLILRGVVWHRGSLDRVAKVLASHGA